MWRISPVEKKVSKSVRNVGTSSAVFTTTERTGSRELGRGISRIRRRSGCTIEVTKVGRAPEGNNRQLMLKNVFSAVRREQQRMMSEMRGSDVLKVVINGIRLGLFTYWFLERVCGGCWPRVTLYLLSDKVTVVTSFEEVSSKSRR